MTADPFVAGGAGQRSDPDFDVERMRVSTLVHEALLTAADARAATRAGQPAVWATLADVLRLHAPRHPTELRLLGSGPDRTTCTGCSGLQQRPEAEAPWPCPTYQRIGRTLMSEPAAYRGVPAAARVLFTSGVLRAFGVEGRHADSSPEPLRPERPQLVFGANQ